MRLSLRLSLGSLALLAPIPCLAQGLPSLQGYTGLLNTPNALVAPEGAADFMFSNQPEVRWRDTSTLNNNTMLTVGMFPWVEGGIRLTVAHEPIGPGVNDLSDNVKVQVPYLPDWFPKIAFGAQDFAGGNSFLRTHYGVMSQDFGPLRLSLGKGTGPNRLKGVFGGGEWTLRPWLQVLGEYDTTDKNIGTKILTPQDFLPGGMTLGLVTKYSLNYQPRHVDLGFSLRIPLAGRPARPAAQAASPAGPVYLTAAPAAPVPGASAPEATSSGPAPATLVLEKTPEAAATPASSPYALTLARDLTALGFENVRTGTRGRTLVVEYENNRFNCNDIDGLGLVLGTVVAGAPDTYDTFLVSLRRQNLRMLDVEGPILPCRQFFRSWDGPSGTLLDTLTIRQAEGFGSPEGVAWAGAVANTGWLHSRLLLGPGLSTVIGTEVGAFNYRLSLIPDLQTSLWRGAVLNWRWDVPLTWSQNYRPGQPFGRLGTTYSLDRIWVAQAIPLAQGLMAQLGGGRYDVQTNGAMGDLLWAPGEGHSLFTFKAAQFRVSGQPDQRATLGAYRYYYAPLETYVTATGGRFYDNDKGYRVDVKRYFRDTAFTVWYSKTDVKKLGFTFSLPLTPRRDMAPGWLQLRGTEAFNYGMSSVIRSPSGANYLTPNAALIPDTTYNLQRSFFNGDRLNGLYLKGHLARLREAYQLFKPVPRT